MGLVAFLSIVAHPIAAAEDAASAPPGIAVIELFTSEGCSSCPAADAVLAAQAAAGRPGVFMLAYHVDYWDRLGWKDPFASASASQRQSGYGRVFGTGRVYTPQAVVNGRLDIGGSEAVRIQAAITRELARPAPARVTLGATWSKRMCTATCVITTTPAKPLSAATLTVALVEDALTDVVTRGENAGKTLTHQRVVREFRSVPVTETIAPVVFTLPEGSIPEHTRVVAYVQDPKLTVIGAAETAWRAPVQLAPVSP